jgi:hypothetical protein
VAEWLKAPLSKSGKPSRASEVRILPSPQHNAIMGSMQLLAPSRPVLRVVSALSANFAVLWLGALFVTQSLIPLLTNLLFGIFAVYLALMAEKLLETYDS